MKATIEAHIGYQWKELTAAEMESVQRFLWTLETGGLLRDARSGRHSRTLPGAPEEIIRRPHLVGITKSEELKRAGSWVGTLFDYRAPAMGFTGAQQRLLRAALSGGTDQEVSAQS